MSTICPTMFRANTAADALQPSVNLAEVVLHRVIGCAFKTEIFLQLHTPVLVPRPDCLTQLWSARKVHFDMRHIVRLGLALLIKVDARNKNKISRLKFVH